MREKVTGDPSVDPALVLVIDDDPSVRRQLQRQLRLEGYEVEAFGSSRAILEYSLPERPTCLVLDVRLAGVSGIDLYAQLKRRGSAPPVVFLTGFGGVPLATRAMKEGAVDFLEKPVRRAALLAAVRAAVAESRKTLAERAEVSGLTGRYESLTPRERQVMDLVVDGAANKVIAIDLGLSERTVEIHRAKVMEKMGARSVAHLVKLQMNLSGGS